MHTKVMKMGMVAALAALMGFSLGVPAFATTGQNGPTPPRAGDPVSTPVPETQLVSVFLTSGTFTLSLAEGTGTCPTGAIAFNAAATAFDTALEGCTGAGSVRVERTNTTAGYFFKVVFDDPDGNISELVANPSGPSNVVVSTVQNGRTAGFTIPDGTGATTTVSTTQPPHGGYSSATDYCVQCHSVHGGGNEFALLRDISVTATCQTCHSLFGAAATGAFDSNDATGENTRLMGSAAARSAYDLGDGGLIGGGAIVRGHQIGGTGGGATGDYSLTDGEITLYAFDSARRSSETTLANDSFPAADVSGATQDGIYCGSCHTPHGDLGQMVNDWLVTDEVAVGTANLTAGDPNVSITFTNPKYTVTGFTSAQRKLTLRFETDGAGQSDFYTRVFTQFSSSGTNSSVGQTGAWANCVRSPATTSGTQTICITDLPAASASGVTVYLGDEGRPIGTGATPNRADYDGETATTPQTGWRSCTSANGAPVLGTGYNPACTGWATATDAEGQLVSLYGYKLLSSGPNHQMAPRDVKQYATVSQSTDAWCGTCHTQRWNFDGQHPMHTAGGGCTACHGNPADGTSYDYPHTSTVGRLLKQLPDGLCLSCHSMLP